jgi:tripartite motif-containing protein 71
MFSAMPRQQRSGPRRHRVIARATAFLALALWIAGGSPGQAAAHGAQAAAGIAAVRFIEHGLGVQPPRKAVHAGHLHDPLFSQYNLRTQSGQKASIGFHDGTVIHLNQNTDAVIASPHLTRVAHGEIAEYLAPGSAHVVQTATASASAIGTTYDVRTTASGSAVFVVLHGALQVHNRRGAVLVKSNHQTTVAPGKPPTPPSPVDARAVFAWTDGIPTPDLGEDVSLDANGGTIQAVSSQLAPAPAPGAVAHIHDGLLSQGWVSGTGTPAGQTVTVGFLGGAAYRIASVIIDPAATANQPPSEDLKDFVIRVSTTDTRPASFTTVLTGRCKQAATLQRFAFPVAIRARYVQLVVSSNYGNPHHVAVAEWEVAATESLFAQPEGIALDAHNHLVVADTGANRILQLSPSGSILHAWGSKGSASGQFNRPDGLTVDPDGNIYVADTDNSRIVKLSPTGVARMTFGSSGTGPGHFISPSGVAVDRAGDIYVADFGNRIQKFSATGKYLTTFSVAGSAGTLSRPNDVAIGPDGDLYVADTGNDRIVKLSTDGTLLAVFGSSGTLTGHFDEPYGIAVDEAGRIYVADSFNDRVQVFDPSLHVMRTFGTPGNGPAQLAVPLSVAVGATGTVYVADTFNSRISRFTSAGRHRGSWGKVETVVNSLTDPEGLTVYPTGDVYISDGANSRLEQRTAAGSRVAALGYFGRVTKAARGLGQFDSPRAIAIDRQGAIYVADTSNNRIQILAPRGPIGAIGPAAGSPGALDEPEGVTVAPNGTIVVADTGHNRLVEFSAQGRFLRAIGHAGSAPGQFADPTSVAADGHGDLYVCDTENHRVQKLSLSGKVLWTLGAPAAPLGRFWAPLAVAVDRSNDVYVADAEQGAVQKLSSSGTYLQDFVLPLPSAIPSAVAVAPNGTVYVANRVQSNVVVFLKAGDITSIWN